MLVSHGHAHPLGPSVISTNKSSKGYVQTVNIAVLSRVTDITLCLFQPLRKQDLSSTSLYIRDVWQRFEFPGRTGNVFHARLEDLPFGTAYTFCVQGKDGSHRLLTDPYAPCVESGGTAEWMRIPGEQFGHSSSSEAASRVENVRSMLASFSTLRELRVRNVFRPALFEDENRGTGNLHSFDWQGYEKPSHSVDDDNLVIYEAHARALGLDGSLESAALRAPYLRWLGVTAVQLMPVFEFAEAEAGSARGEEYIISRNKNIVERRGNHWGYAPLSFFAPMNRYSKRAVSGGPVALRTFVREMHKHGIRVILDVVYNHTANASCAFHFLGVQREYFLEKYEDKVDLETHKDRPEGFKHCNFSGCGNTIAANKPHAQDLIIRSLKHFVKAYNIDGFRIDAAGVLCRDPRTGAPVDNPSILNTMVNDPELAGVRLIVEGWDAGDQVGSPNFLFGSFPHGDRFREWNATWRDSVRRFFKSVSIGGVTPSDVHGMRHALCGTPEVYARDNRLHGVHFVSCHDGFCLADLVSYCKRTNIDDGYDEVSFDCKSSNSGAATDEGDSARNENSDDIEGRRTRMIKNMLLCLFVSSGVPMLTQGDELGFTKNGHSNTWNHPYLFAAKLPAKPQLCTDRDGLVQFVHTLLKVRARNACVAALDYGGCLTWVDAEGQEVEDILYNRSEDERVHSGVDSNHPACVGAVKTEFNAESEKGAGENPDENENVRTRVIAFIRPPRNMTPCAGHSDAVHEAMFVAFNCGADDEDVSLPEYKNMSVTWTFQVNTHNAKWRQDTRHHWGSGERVKLHGEAAILFTGKLRNVVHVG